MVQAFHLKFTRVAHKSHQKYHPWARAPSHRHAHIATQTLIRLYVKTRKQAHTSTEHKHRTAANIHTHTHKHKSTKGHAQSPHIGTSRTHNKHNKYISKRTYHTQARTKTQAQSATPARGKSCEDPQPCCARRRLSPTRHQEPIGAIQTKGPPYFPVTLSR